MIAVVLVKSVPLGAGSLRIAGGGLTRDGVAHGLDPVNELTLEWALRRREAGEVAEVVAVTMGPDSARGALQSALALGADRAVLVRDERLAGADVRRTIAVLAAVARQMRAQLVLCGYESGDGSSGAVPAGLASTLGWALVTRAGRAELRDGALRAERDTGAAEQVLEAALPAVVSFAEGAIVPRRATLKDTIQARRRPIAELDLDALDCRAEFDGPAEEVVGLRLVGDRVSDPLVLGEEAGVEHVHGLLLELADS